MLWRVFLSESKKGKRLPDLRWGREGREHSMSGRKNHPQPSQQKTPHQKKKKRTPPGLNGNEPLQGGKNRRFYREPLGAQRKRLRAWENSITKKKESTAVTKEGKGTDQYIGDCTGRGLQGATEVFSWEKTALYLWPKNSMWIGKREKKVKLGSERSAHPPEPSNTGS